MFEFHGADDGALDLLADFAAVPYANISFFDAARADILLHVSLRADQAIAVFNRRIGGVWQAERPVPVRIRPGPNAAAFRFGGDGAQVTLNGQVLFDLTAADVPGLPAIGWQEVTGGFDPFSFVLGGAANLARRGLGGLVHMAPFGLAGWGLDPALARQVLTLEVEGTTEPPLLLCRPNPDLAPLGQSGIAPVAAQAELPGRVWAGLPPAAPLILHLRANGNECGAPLVLPRADFAVALDLVLQQPGITSATRTAILALEHVHHGGFWPDLSTPAKTALRKIASASGLQALLPGPDPLPPPVPPALDGVLADQAFQDISAAFRADPSRDIAALLDNLPMLTLGARRQLYLQLTDLYCAEGRFEVLYAKAAADGVAAVTEVGTGWQRSIHLPFLLASGQIGRLRDVFSQVAADDKSWISTASVAWVVARICDPAATLPRREELIYPFLDLLTRRSADYWGRASCVHLMGAMIRLLACAPRLPDWMEQRLIEVALKVQGLSPGFWALLDQAVAAGHLPLHPTLSAARNAFQTIARRMQGEPVPPHALDAAFALFAWLGAVDAPRMRRELLGPLGLSLPAPDAAALTGHLIAQPEGLGINALRALAFPADPPLLPPDLTRDLMPLLRQTVASAHWGLAHAPLHRLQAEVSQHIAGLLARVTAPDAEMLDRLFGDMGTLAQDRGLGLALAIALYDGLLRQGRSATIPDLLDRIQRLWSAQTGEAQIVLTQSLPVQNALAALIAHNGDAPFARGLLESLAPSEPPPPLPTAAPELTAPPLFDALVLVISCAPYLGSRIPALQAAWLDRLADFGVPWLVVVGGASGPARVDGHVLHLDCADDYEGLPQKVLAAFAWAAAHTSAAHVLKIDDDCFLDAESFFHAQSWRKFAYYGRKLRREPGQMDRAWHQAKSTSARGRLELDKSPEPSTYCDGGSGYVLSRQALTALTEQAASPEGQRLIQASFMEDKLVGDLLVLSGIEPADEDHLVAIQRRGHKGATPVSLWSNTFLPSLVSGIKLVHLDRVESQVLAAEMLTRPTLWPPKIWPSYAAPGLGYNTNVLELVSPVSKLQELNSGALAVVSTMRNEMFMLPHFLAHYRNMGVRVFLIADNLSDDGTLDYLLAQPDVVTFSVDSEYRVSQYGVAWQQAILSNLRVGRWSLVADADELLVAEAGVPLAETLAGFGDVDAVRLFMLDMYPAGPLSGATFEAGGPFSEAGFCDRVPFRTDWPGRGPFGDQPTWTSALRHRLIPGWRPELFVAQKVALLKYQPWMRLSAGLHYVGDTRLAARELIFAHFKYNAEFAGKVRAEVARGQHFNNAEEYRRYQALLQEGREVIFDPGCSVPWRDCTAVQGILRRD